MKVEDLSKEEQATIKEWNKARVRWWTYTPTQLRKLEREMEDIYKKLNEE